jgi:hypothetical protein
VDRFRRLEKAMAIARTVPYTLEQAHAADWLESQLRTEPGIATVVYHSVVWPYLSDDEKQRMTGAIERAGAQATTAAPLAWLRMEPGGTDAELRLRIYPGLDDRVIATCGFHSPAVRWLG